MLGTAKKNELTVIECLSKRERITLSITTQFHKLIKWEEIYHEPMRIAGGGGFDCARTHARTHADMHMHTYNQGVC